MNKASLIEFVASAENVSKKDAKNYIESVLAGIVNGLTNDGKVTLVGFGTFELTAKAARTARNPKTGEPIDVPAKTVPKFRPSAALKATVVDVDMKDLGADDVEGAGEAE
jgi:DNA-binding protein HU-beta